MGKEFTLSEIKQAYDKNINIMKLLREEGSDVNSPLAIHISYELQTGSYTEGMSNPATRAIREKNGELLRKFLSKYLEEGASLMEAGVGEASTLALFVSGLEAPLNLYGFDISWSRLHYAAKFLKKETGREASLFMADLANIPLADDAIDVVFTCHSIEPNKGRELGILKELYRVSKRALALIEPAYELADEEQKKRMDEHGYCRGLYDIAKEAGWSVAHYSLWENNTNLLNPSMLLLIEKEVKEKEDASYICPSCKKPLTFSGGHLFCEGEGLLFPVIKGIPYLTPSSALLAVKYLE